jgi:3-oxoacyl-[acyl-carrier-protein] synthase-3
MQLTKAAITGVCGYVPEHVLSNADLEATLDTSDEWITTRTGIKERRILKGEGLGTSYMAVKAVKSLLEKTHTDPAEIDLLICATITPDYITPATSNIIAYQVGAINAFSYDLNAACSGFLYALVAGEQYITSGKCKKVIVVGADKMSSITNYQDRSTCILFGDGAGAVLLEPSNDSTGLIDSIMKTDGSGENFLYQKAGGSKRPPSQLTVQNKEHYVYQDGKNVFKVAVNRMTEAVEEIIQRNGLSTNDIKFIVPHQANKRIIDLIAKNIGISENKVMLTIQEFGNTTAATIPLCLWKHENLLSKGDNLIFVAFGGGFTWGSVYLKWAYDYKSN